MGFINEISEKNGWNDCIEYIIKNLNTHTKNFLRLLDDNCKQYYNTRYNHFDIR